MNVINLLAEIDDIIFKAKTELACENEFCTEQNLVKLRELLNSQPELEAGGACEKDRPSKNSAGPFDWIISGPPAGERS